MAELVQQGKVRHLGLSEASADTLRRASPCTRSPRCRASGRCGRATSRTRCSASPASTASASCPTARSAAASSPARSPARRLRRGATSAAHMPRFQARHLRAQPAAGRARSARWPRSGRDPGAAGAGLGAAQGDDVVPIPGTKRRLPGGERRGGGHRAHRRGARAAREIARPAPWPGERYPAEGMATVSSSRPPAPRAPEPWARAVSTIGALCSGPRSGARASPRSPARAGRSRRAGARRRRRCRRARPRPPAGRPGPRAVGNERWRHDAAPGAVSPIRMHSDSSEASTLPPPAPRTPRLGGASTCPCISAATATAPAPSTTSLAEEQKDHGLGDLVVGHGHYVVQIPVDKGERVVARRLYRDPVEIVLAERARSAAGPPGNRFRAQAAACTPPRQAPGSSPNTARPNRRPGRPPPSGTTTSRGSGDDRDLETDGARAATTSGASNACRRWRPRRGHPGRLGPGLS